MRPNCTFRTRILILCCVSKDSIFFRIVLRRPMRLDAHSEKKEEPLLVCGRPWKGTRFTKPYSQRSHIILMFRLPMLTSLFHYQIQTSFMHCCTMPALIASKPRPDHCRFGCQTLKSLFIIRYWVQRRPCRRLRLCAPRSA